MRIPKTMFVLCGALAALLSAAPAMAAIDTFIAITGSRQGVFKGNAGSEQIQLVSVVHTAASGMSTGKRMHTPIVITKEVDQASPLFFQALSTNETLKTVTITFRGGSGGGKTVQRIVLTDATIASVRKSGRNEVITLNYQNIEVTWTDGGKTATDDWEAPI